MSFASPLQRFLGQRWAFVSPRVLSPGRNHSAPVVKERDVCLGKQPRPDGAGVGRTAHSEGESKQGRLPEDNPEHEEDYDAAREGSRLEADRRRDG